MLLLLIHCFSLFSLLLQYHDASLVLADYVVSSAFATVVDTLVAFAPFGAALHVAFVIGVFDVTDALPVAIVFAFDVAIGVAADIDVAALLSSATRAQWYKLFMSVIYEFS